MIEMKEEREKKMLELVIRKSQQGRDIFVRLLRETRGCKWHEKIRKKKWKRQWRELALKQRGESWLDGSANREGRFGLLLRESRECKQNEKIKNREEDEEMKETE